MSSTHPTEGDDSRRGDINWNAPQSYIGRGRDNDQIGVGTITTGQPEDEVARYGEDKIHAQACMVYHMSL
jgi:hypothetical protein